MFKRFENAADFQAEERTQSLIAPEISATVADILQAVRTGGDEKIKKFTDRFDRCKVEELRVPQSAIARSVAGLCASTRTLFENTIMNVRKFHELQIQPEWSGHKSEGSRAGVRYNAIGNAGLYVPGGRAAYPSTVIMTAIPAQLAKVGRIVLVSPPDLHGNVNPLVLAAVGLLGLDEVYAMGGAQAIAALAFGTETIERVDKIVGPGNAYVNEAKRQVFGIVGIDSLAGPTELAIVADDSAVAEHVVRDLFAQAEHDPDARVVCITTSTVLAEQVEKLMPELLPNCERRDIIEASIAHNGALVLVRNSDEAAVVVNQVAPEHLQIMVASPDELLSEIQNAGAIFIGNNTPAVAGDYGAGPNHVLPTGGTARFSSPLGVWDFVKASSVLQYQDSDFADAAATFIEFAQLEGLSNHGEAISCRRK